MASPQPSCPNQSLTAGMTQNEFDAWVVFKVDELDFAVSLAAVERIERAVEITTLPEAPRGVRGVINYKGKIVPVFDLHMRFGLPSKEICTTDHLIIAHTQWRTVALLVDTVSGVVSRAEAQITPAAEILPDLDSITGVMKLDGDMVQVHDLERFLSIEDHTALQLLLNLQS